MIHGRSTDAGDIIFVCRIQNMETTQTTISSLYDHTTFYYAFQTTTDSRIGRYCGHKNKSLARPHYHGPRIHPRLIRDIFTLYRAICMCIHIYIYIYTHTITIFKQDEGIMKSASAAIYSFRVCVDLGARFLS